MQHCFLLLRKSLRFLGTAMGFAIENRKNRCDFSALSPYSCGSKLQTQCRGLLELSLEFVSKLAPSTSYPYPSEMIWFKLCLTMHGRRRPNLSTWGQISTETPSTSSNSLKFKKIMNAWQLTNQIRLVLPFSPLLGVPKPGYLRFLRSFALICALLRVFAPFSVRPCLEQPRLGTADYHHWRSKPNHSLSISLGLRHLIS